MSVDRSSNTIWREGGKDGWMEGGGTREGGREGGREGEGTPKEGGREGIILCDGNYGRVHMAWSVCIILKEPEQSRVAG